MISTPPRSFRLCAPGIHHHRCGTKTLPLVSPVRRIVQMICYHTTGFNAVLTRLGRFIRRLSVDRGTPGHRNRRRRNNHIISHTISPLLRSTIVTYSAQCGKKPDAVSSGPGLFFPSSALKLRKFFQQRKSACRNLFGLFDQFLGHLRLGLPERAEAVLRKCKFGKIHRRRF